MSKKDGRTAIARAMATRQVEQQDRLDAPYERALGKLSIRFSLLHTMLEQFSWEVWGMKGGVASVITKDLPTKHLVKKLRDTAHLVTPTEERHKEFRSILNRLEKVSEKRNEFLHSIWILQEGKPTFCLSRKRGRLVGPDAPSAEDIETLCRCIMNIVADFMEFRDGKSLVTRTRDSQIP